MSEPKDYSSFNSLHNLPLPSENITAWLMHCYADRFNSMEADGEGDRVAERLDALVHYDPDTDEYTNRGWRALCDDFSEFLDMELTSCSTLMRRAIINSVDEDELWDYLQKAHALAHE